MRLVLFSTHSVSKITLRSALISGLSGLACWSFCQKITLNWSKSLALSKGCLNLMNKSISSLSFSMCYYLLLGGAFSRGKVRIRGYRFNFLLVGFVNKIWRLRWLMQWIRISLKLSMLSSIYSSFIIDRINIFLTIPFSKLTLTTSFKKPL